jgi:hypothetical protein
MKRLERKKILFRLPEEKVCMLNVERKNVERKNVEKNIEKAKSRKEKCRSEKRRKLKMSKRKNVELIENRVCC